MGVFGGAVVGLLFPGQGSQYVEMGRDLALASAVVRQTFEEADEVLGFSLSRLCFEGPEAELTRTSNAQPAILTHSIAVHRALAGQLDDVVLAAGHSLGEFTAYVAAGSLTFGDALRTVRRRGELMETSGSERPGTMAALLGMSDEAVDDLCRSAAALGGDCVAANYNAPGQIVISGDVDTVQRALAMARELGARRAIPLNVSGAFHSPLMADAEEGLATQLDGVSFQTPNFPVVSNVTGQAITEAETARRLLLQQLIAPVRWTACMRTMLDAGVRRFLELGPGSVLTGLLRRFDRNADGRAIGSAEELAAISSP